VFGLTVKRVVNEVEVIVLPAISLHNPPVNLGTRIKNKALEVKKFIIFIMKRAFESYTVALSPVDG
jgi:hypothetical protein